MGGSLQHFLEWCRCWPSARPGFYQELEHSVRQYLSQQQPVVPQLQYTHECRGFGCNAAQCNMCRNALSKRCKRNIKQRYQIHNLLLPYCMEAIECSLSVPKGGSLPDVATRMSHTRSFLMDYEEYVGICGRLDGKPPGWEDLHPSFLGNNQKNAEMFEGHGAIENYLQRRIIAGANPKAVISHPSSPQLQTRVVASTQTYAKSRKKDACYVLVTFAFSEPQPPTSGEASSSRQQPEVLRDILPAVSEPFKVGTAGRDDAPLRLADPVANVVGIGGITRDIFMDMGRYQDKDKEVYAALKRFLGGAVPNITTVEEFLEFSRTLSKDKHLLQQFLQSLSLTNQGWQKAQDHANTAVHPDARPRLYIYHQHIPSPLRVVFPATDGGVDLNASPLRYEIQDTDGSVQEVPANSDWALQQREYLLHVQRQAAADWLADDHPNWQIYTPFPAPTHLPPHSAHAPQPAPAPPMYTHNAPSPIDASHHGHADAFDPLPASPSGLPFDSLQVSRAGSGPHPGFTPAPRHHPDRSPQYTHPDRVVQTMSHSPRHSQEAVEQLHQDSHLANFRDMLHEAVRGVQDHLLHPGMMHRQADTQQQVHAHHPQQLQQQQYTLPQQQADALHPQQQQQQYTLPQQQADALHPQQQQQQYTLPQQQVHAHHPQQPQQQQYTLSQQQADALHPQRQQQQYLLAQQQADALHPQQQQQQYLPPQQQADALLHHPHYQHPSPQQQERSQPAQCLDDRNEAPNGAGDAEGGLRGLAPASPGADGWPGPDDEDDGPMWTPIGPPGGLPAPPEAAAPAAAANLHPYLPAPEFDLDALINEEAERARNTQGPTVGNKRAPPPTGRPGDKDGSLSFTQKDPKNPNPCVPELPTVPLPTAAASPATEDTFPAPPSFISFGMPDSFLDSLPPYTSFSLGNFPTTTLPTVTLPTTTLPAAIITTATLPTATLPMRQPQSTPTAASRPHLHNPPNPTHPAPQLLAPGQQPAAGTTTHPSPSQPGRLAGQAPQASPQAGPPVTPDQLQGLELLPPDFRLGDQEGAAAGQGEGYQAALL